MIRLRMAVAVVFCAGLFAASVVRGQATDKDDNPELNPDVLAWLSKLEQSKQMRIDAVRERNGPQRSVDNIRAEEPIAGPFVGFPIEVGMVGDFGSGVKAGVLQVIDDQNLIAQLIDIDAARPRGKQMVWIRGVDTRKMADDTPFEFDGFLLATGTKRYESDIGTRQFVMLESFDLGPYYAKLKDLGELAQDVKPDKPKPPVVSAPDAKPNPPEEDAATRLKLAKSLIKQNPDKAEKRLKEIVEKFPKTIVGKEAAKLLKVLQKRGRAPASLPRATADKMRGVDEERTTAVWPWITAALVAMLILTTGYLASYVRMVRLPLYVSIGGVGPFEMLPDYRGERQNRDQAFWAKAFGPAHWLDRRIRRHRWIVE